MATLKLQPGEAIIFDSPGSYVYDNNTSKEGRCVLTSQRVVFCTASLPGFLAKLFGGKPSNIFYEVPINTVLSLQQAVRSNTKGGTFHTVTTVGNYSFTLLLANKYNIRWITGFQTAIEQGNPGAQMQTRNDGFDVIAAA